MFGDHGERPRETVSKIESNVDYMQKGLVILSQIFHDLYFLLRYET